MIPQHIQNIIKQRYQEENWLDAATRVSTVIASVEKTEELRKHWEDQFFNIIKDTTFVPGGRISAEAGRSNQMMNCSVTPVNNSLEELFKETIYSEMRLYSRSGSSGFDLSKLTPRGQKTKRGYAAGPVAFMSLIGKVAKTIYQESTRDPGSMGILRIDHPDILEFIEAKSVPNDLNKKILQTITQIIDDELGLNDPAKPHLIRRIQKVLIEKYQFPNFNISVAVTDDFIKKFNETPDNPVVTTHDNKQEVLGITYADLFYKIAQSSWRFGEPGIIFIDTINKFHPIPDIVSATNVCAEIPLLKWENCVLGHLNLIKIYHDVGNNWDKFLDRLLKVIHIVVRFLDNVIDATSYATKDYERVQKMNRKIGLGVVGFADLLLEEGIEYGANSECASLIKELGNLIRRESYEASIKLAEEKGYNKQVWKKIQQKNKVRGKVNPYEILPRRNVCLNTIAPTGTGSLIAQWDDKYYTVSSGIEPWFSFEIHRIDETTGEKGQTYDVHPLIQKLFNENQITGKDNPPYYFKNALNISPKDHLFVLAEWQKYVDHSISKTINCPKETKPEEILQLLLDAHDMGCKSFTVYRAGSREFEVLKDASKSTMYLSGKKVKVQDTEGNNIGFVPEEIVLKVSKKENKQIRSISNEARYGITISIPTGHSKLHVTITEDENEIPTEVYCNLGKGGTDEASSTEAMGRVISSWLQHIYTLDDALHVLRVVSEQLRGIGGLKQKFHNGDLVRSIWDGLSKIISDYCELKDPTQSAEPPKKPSTLENTTYIYNPDPDVIVCPNCNSVFKSKEKCPKCPKCNFSECG